MSCLNRFLPLLLTITLAFAWGCGDDTTSATPSVAIDGAHSLAVGESVTLTASTKQQSDASYAWSSSDSGVATVDDSGTVTGISVGETVLTARGANTGASSSHVIVVTESSEGVIVVSVSGTPFVEVDDLVALTATTKGADDESYTWTSSDEAIATVANDGTVMGLSAGEVSIEATGADTAVTGSLLVVVQYDLPQYDQWLGSAHADITAEAFNHWNEEDPPEVPASCAKCHSTPGFRDFIGADGSAPEQVDSPAAIGSVIECSACHNSAASELDSVTFPSGEVVDQLGAEARCMTCHQGRSSTDDVDDAIELAAVGSDDEVSADLNFQNIHYYAAAATLNAGRVRGGYQYEGQVYDWRFRHVPGYDTCLGCHDAHTLEVKVDACASCHDNISTKEDLKTIRMIASRGQDYDGDGDKSEGIYFEIQGLRSLLLETINAYTVDQGLGAICYSAETYPYWFQDTNQNGTCEEDEEAFSNGFASWSARLLRATYNFQVATKDPGAFAHNGKYIIQLLYDATTDLNSTLTTPIDTADTVRNDFGHFNGASEAARHWDEDEAVSPSCSKCHGGSDGFRFFLKHGVGTADVEPDNGLDCATCHDNYTPTWDVVAVDSVTFPSGITITEPGQTSNVCYICHSGRESKKTIDDAIAANQLGFKNVHYLVSGAVKKGTEAKVGYEYPNKSYAAEWTTHGRCINCHEPVATNHTFSPYDNPTCTDGCHAPTAIELIRTNHTLDYDGDADATEPLANELDGLGAALLATMQSVSGTPQLCYNSGAYPYFFKDNDQSGVCEAAESVFSNSFKAWTPALMKAAHNYQINQKDPGAWAHNFDYMSQLLFDSIEDLGGNTATFVRP